jgi:hypothetical protein
VARIVFAASEGNVGKQKIDGNVKNYNNIRKEINL